MNRFLLKLFVLFALLICGCSKPQSVKMVPQKAPRSAPKPPALPKGPWVPAAIAHAGVMTPPGRADGCRKAVDAALAALEKGADPLDAAVAGVVVLEDDPRFNAGTGSLVRLDGSTVQMDASVMDSKGRFGAVAVIEGVKNPVRAARAVADTPHRIIAGDGATLFARTLGHKPYDPVTDARREEAEKLRQLLVKKDSSLPEVWRSFDWRSRWNFEKTIKEAGMEPESLGSDTVGVVVRSKDGRFAGALSTGGWTIALHGRVGDVPIRGAGLFAGKYGAAAATGTGERIIDELGAYTTVWQMSQGIKPGKAAARVVDRIAGTGSIGLIVMSPTEMTAVADRRMAWAARELGSNTWLGPEPAKSEAVE